MLTAIPRPGDRIGPYAVIGEIGRGGMGAVYRVRHEQTGAEHALKLILPSGWEGPDAEEIARFEREAQVLARLGADAGVVGVHATGTHAGLLYCVMELLDGESLQDRSSRTGPIPPEEAVRILIPVARALDRVHREGLVHRDLKPANIFIRADGRPCVLDFGLALDAAATRLTETGVILGTPAFMAPEQVDEQDAGGPVGPATDVYALGAVLYALLTGSPPFERADPRVMLAWVLMDAPVPPRRRAPSVPEELDAVVMKCLEKPPGWRYPSAAALADELDRWLAGDPVEARPVGRLAQVGHRVGRWSGRTRLAAGLVAALGVALVAAGASLGATLLRDTALTPLDRVRRIEADLARVGELTDDQRAVLSDLQQSLGPAQVSRVEAMIAADRIVRGPEDARAGAVRALAGALRSEQADEESRGAMRKLALDHLSGARRHAELAQVLFGASPSLPVPPELAGRLAAAIVADDGIPLPADRSALDDLLKAVARHEHRVALRRRWALELLPSDPRAATDELTAIVADEKVPPAALALDPPARRAVLMDTAARLAPDGSLARPEPFDRAARLLARLEELPGLATDRELFGHIHRLSPMIANIQDRGDENVLRAASLFEGTGLSPLRTDTRFLLPDIEWLAKRADSELARQTEDRNPATMLYLARALAFTTKQSRDRAHARLARALAEGALELVRGRRWAHAAAAETLASLGDHEESLEHWQAAIDIDRTSPQGTLRWPGLYVRSVNSTLRLVEAKPESVRGEPVPGALRSAAAIALEAVPIQAAAQAQAELIEDLTPRPDPWIFARGRELWHGLHGATQARIGLGTCCDGEPPFERVREALIELSSDVDGPSDRDERLDALVEQHAGSRCPRASERGAR